MSAPCRWPALFREGVALFCLAWLLLTAAPSLASPSGFRYDIDLRVPEPQRALLESFLDLYRWRDSERMDETQLQRMVRLAPEQVRTLLSTEGYYSATVTASLGERDGRPLAMLTVEPGEPVRVRQIRLNVTGPFEDGSRESQARLAKMREAWSLPSGAVFRHARWETAKREALKALLLERYPDASIMESRATVDPDAHAVDLQVVLASGPAYRFGTLQVEGLKRYPESLVERLNPIRAGEPYSQAKLLDFQARLQDSQYFSSAIVSVDTDPEHPEQTPVRVQVTEERSKKLSVGIGMSTDAGLRGQMDYGDLNFLHRAWHLTNGLKLEKKSQSLGNTLQFPLTAEGYRDSLDARLERTDIEGEVTRKMVLGATRSRMRGHIETSVGARYYLETQDVAGVGGDGRAALVFSASWTQRTLDDLLYPTRGHVLDVQVDGAARALLSDRDFLRTDARAAWLHAFGKRDQMSLRGEVGVVFARSRDGIPSDFLFRTGGDQSVRGYDYQSLGVQEGEAVVGGRYLAVASAEYTHWFSSDWGAALFEDLGFASDSLHDIKPVRGSGIGARWKSPLGPLKLDLAYGHATSQVRLHFSIGLNF